MLKTLGEIEAAISDGINRFEQESIGRGPKFINDKLTDSGVRKPKTAQPDCTIR